jgi:Zinc dependent phospholipase C
LSLLLSVVFKSVCHSTHHRLAVDALRHLRCPEAERWCDLFLHYRDEYLAGSTAPDERFQDFRNHVVHVAEGNWGGAPQESRRWYGRLVDGLRRREWAEAVFAAGALSHYFSDPFMPLHTARSEEDTKVHRPLEWCIRKSYGRLQQIIERDHGGYPQLETPRSDEWLERMVLTGAELAHEHYDAVLQHFDLARATRDPLAGMDQECQDRIAQCLSHAVIGLARVLERAVAEAEVESLHVETTLQGFVAALGAPLRSVSHHLRDLSERMAIEAILDESLRSGKVVKNLTMSDREIRRWHAEEVLRVPLFQLDQQSAGLTGTLYGSGQPERFHPNRLITDAVLPRDTAVSAAWRDAQRRIQERSKVSSQSSRRMAA